MNRRHIEIVALCAAVAACDTSGRSLSLVVGEENAGGTGTTTVSSGGSDSLVNPRTIDPVRVDIENPDRVTVELVTLSCPGECVTLEAVARGGYPPYTYEWNDGSLDSTRTFCPGSTTQWVVSATDSGFSSSEFRRDPETAQGSVTAEVLACSGVPTPDGGTSMGEGGGTSSDGGVPMSDGAIDSPEPPGELRELCSQRWPLLNQLSVTITEASTSMGGVATGADGSIVFSGSFAGSVDFGGGPLRSLGALDAFVVKLDRDCRHVWSRRFGGPVANVVARAVTLDASSNVLFSGSFGAGAVDFGSGAVTPEGEVEDAFLVKLDPSGNAIWTRPFHSPFGATVAHTVGTDGQNVFVSGVGAPNLDLGGGPLVGTLVPTLNFLAKFDSAGSHVWSRALPLETPWSVAVAADGTVALTAPGGARVDWGGNNIDNYESVHTIVAKLDADGQFGWSIGLGQNDPDVTPSTEVAVSGAGNIGILGVSIDGPPVAADTTFTSHVDPTGTERWRVVTSGPASPISPYSLSKLAVDPADSVTIAVPSSGTLEMGSESLTSAGRDDIFITRLDSSGAHEWSTRIGGSGQERLFGLATDANGNVVTLGSTDEENVLFLIKIGR